jgi:hypothetical protein
MKSNFLAVSKIFNVWTFGMAIIRLCGRGCAHYSPATCWILSFHLTMTPPMRIVVALVALATLPCPAAPTLLPQPKSLTPGTGSLTIKTGNRVVAQGATLEPLAKILASDIERMHGVKLVAGPLPAAAGDIVLRLAPAAAEFKGIDAYRISVDKGVIVEGRTYQAVAMGMMTVLQALQNDGASLKIERMTVVDSADRAFRALQLSIRGAYHSPQWVKKGIDLTGVRLN